MPEPGEQMTLVQAAARYGRAKQTLNYAVRRGRLNATKVGNQYVVTDADMQAYLNSMPVGAQLRNQARGLPTAHDVAEAHGGVPVLQLEIVSPLDGSRWSVRVDRLSDEPWYLATVAGEGPVLIGHSGDTIGTALHGVIDELFPPA